MTRAWRSRSDVTIVSDNGSRSRATSVDDAIVSRVGAAPRRVRDEHAVVFAFWVVAERSSVEHHCDVVAGPACVVLQRGDQARGRAVAVAPPPVGPSADHVHRVDDQPAAGMRAHVVMLPGARCGRRDLAVVGVELEHFGAGCRISGPRRDEHTRQPRERRVPFAGRRIPRGVVHLRPLVGAHHHDVVARGDVDDELRVRHDDAELRSSGRDPFERPLPALDVGRDPPCRARRARSRSRDAPGPPAAIAASAIATCAIVGGSNVPG